jgi:hypothetical protein
MIVDSTLSDTTKDVGGLLHLTKYYWRVRGKNEAGWGEYSKWSEFTTIVFPSLQLLSPTGEESWVANSVQQIGWEFTNVRKIKIEFSSNGGGHWETVVDSTNEGQTTYAWHLPNIESSQCKIKISSIDEPWLSSENETPFKIFKYREDDIPISLEITFPSELKSDGYIMFGLPGAIELNFADFMEGKAGLDWDAYYDNGIESNDWRDYLVEYNENDEYFYVKAGRGYWVISRNAIRLSKRVMPVRITDEGTYRIKLNRKGWTLISNPFEKSIPWRWVVAKNKLSSNAYIYSYPYPLSFDMNTLMFKPFTAYYFANRDHRDYLDIPYEVNENNPMYARVVSDISPSYELSLKKSGKVLQKIEIAYNDTAEEGMDNMDILAPPVGFGEWLYIRGNNSEVRYNREIRDVRKRIVEEGVSYEISLGTKEGERYELVFDDYENDNAKEKILINTETGEITKLNDKGKMVYYGTGKEGKLLLAIGSEAFIRKLEKKYLPREYKLYQNYPNPFNPSTMIMYSIAGVVGKDGAKSGPVDVSLEIYNTLGERVARLVNEKQMPGNYSVWFNAKELPSGVYFYRLQAGNFVATKKMVLLK